MNRFTLLIGSLLVATVIHAATAPQPISLPLPSGTLEVFDPSLEAAADNSALWLLYSGSSLSGSVNPGNAIALGTRIASSTDHGAHWTDAGISVFPATLQPLPPPDNEGIWVYEVASLAYDPGAPAAQRWKAFVFRYLVNNGARLFDHSWIALKTAAAPNGTWSTERKLFTGAYYVTGDNAFIGPPEVILNAISDGHGGTPLADCAAFTEPGAISKPDALYVALNCATGGLGDRIILVKLSHPSETWSYVGVIIRNSEAPSGFNGMSAADLFNVNGVDYALISPSLGNGYRGCRLYQFAAITSALLVKQNGVPVSQLLVPDDGSDNNGACSYESLATASGILSLKQYLAPNPPSVQLMANFTTIPSGACTTPTGVSSLNSIQVFPNPLRSSLGHTKMNFNQMPPDARLRIYTLAGEKVFDAVADSFGSASWDGTNRGGKKVSSGVYMVYVQGSEASKTLKVAVQR